MLNHVYQDCVMLHKCTPYSVKSVYTAVYASAIHSYLVCALLTFSCTNFSRINDAANATHFVALGAKTTIF